MRKICLLSTVLLCAPLIVPAQDDGVAPVIFFGGGPSFTTDRMSDYIKNGFHFSAGGGVRTFRSIEFLGEFSYNDLGVRDTVLQSLNVPGGDARVYSVTGNVKLPLTTGRMRPFVIVGGGWYRRTVDFTEPATGFVTVFDPWWGWIGEVAVPTNRVLGSVSRDAGGLNAGGGVSFDLGEQTRLFAQVR